MATIDMSPAFGLGYTTRMIGVNAFISGTTIAQIPYMNSFMRGGYSPAGSNTQLYIMKGVPPTSFSTLASFDSRGTDVLATFGTSSSYDGPTGAVGSGHGDFLPSSLLNVNPVTISTNYVAAASAGTATWFWLVQRQFGNGAGASVYLSTLYHQIIGTVGTIGSGADLEIPDTNIVAGNAYRILNLRLQFPTTWTFA